MAIAIMPWYPERLTGIRTRFEDYPLGDYGLATTFLDMPIRFRIGDVELMGLDDRPYGHAPILGLARWGLAALEEARTSGSCVYEIIDSPAALLMEIDGPSNVVIHSTYTCNTAIVSWEELHDAWKEFAEWVRRVVAEAFDGIERYEFEGWDKWFAGYFSEQPQPEISSWYNECWPHVREAKRHWGNEA